jgi:hypothetical protein
VSTLRAREQGRASGKAPFGSPAILLLRLGNGVFQRYPSLMLGCERRWRGERARSSRFFQQAAVRALIAFRKAELEPARRVPARGQERSSAKLSVKLKSKRTAPLVGGPLLAGDRRPALSALRCVSAWQVRARTSTGADCAPREWRSGRGTPHVG